jgi:tetratricopeptide (TPR) repeat protein
MGGRDRQRQKKRREREERLRRAKHERRYGSSPGSEPSEPEEDLSAEDAAEQEQGISPFLWESAIRRTQLLSAAWTLPGRGELKAGLQELSQQDEEQPEELLPAEPASRAEIAKLKRQLKRLRKRSLDQEAELVELLLPPGPEDEEELSRRIGTLEEAVGRWEQLVSDEGLFGNREARLWDQGSGRSYLRSRKALAEALWRAERIEAALPHLQTVLELDPEDHLHVRWTQLGLHLEGGGTARARAVLDQMAQEFSTVAVWGRVLERFLVGDRVEAARALRRARRHNSLVESVLVPIEEDESLSEEGDRISSETIELIAHLGRAWKRHPEATRWLQDGGRETTIEARASALASYVPPVSSLLSIGEPKLGLDWPDYRALYDLGPDQIPELIRLAVDPAVHECESDSLEVWATVHAWRALAQLRAAEAVGPLVGLARERSDDDWVTDELSEVFVLIGTASLAPLRHLLVDKDASDEARFIAAYSLGQIGERDPSTRDGTVHTLVQALEGFGANSEFLNGILIGELVQLRASQTLSLIERAFASERVETAMSGELEWVREEIGAPQSPWVDPE